uniref:Putative secreted protein n=1 Tax=Ixodes scapularis TaxID=6945 RepID=A0A4D5RF13_IXOSC
MVNTRPVLVCVATFFGHFVNGSWWMLNDIIGEKRHCACRRLTSSWHLHNQTSRFRHRHVVRRASWLLLVRSLFSL